MKKIILSIAMMVLLLPIHAQQGQAYAIYDSKGNVTTFGKMVDEVAKADIICFGELHNNTLAHWLELQTFKALINKEKKIVLGLEMLEADNQIILDEWQADLIDTEKMNNDLRLWPNHSTDYQPLIDAAKESQIRVVATNVPRRYASMVNYRGLAVLDSLSATAKSFMAPLPIKYQSDEAASKFFEMMSGMGGHANGERLQQAQAIKDATMAWHIAKAMPAKVFHVNGNFHSDNHSGIVMYLKEYKPTAKVVTISTIIQENISKLEKNYKGVADFILCIPDDMARSY